MGKGAFPEDHPLALGMAGIWGTLSCGLFTDPTFAKYNAVADVIGYARDGDDACVTVLRIRGGKLLSREQRFLENIDGEEDAGVGGGSDELIDAGRDVARLEGVLTDPVYEGKSMAALIDLVRSGRFPSGSRVLYAHLGGQPALNAYSGVF